MKFAKPCVLLSILLTALAAGPGHASENRFQIVDQLDFGGKRGFALSLENSSPGDTPCPLKTLKLIWGVGDGKALHFLAPPAGGWQVDHDYTVQAAVDAQGARLMLDGKTVAEDDAGRLAPITGPVLAGAIPGWAHGPADYWIVLTDLHVTPQSGKPLALTFPALSPTLMLFEPQTPQRVENWTLASGRSLTVQAVFHLSQPPPDLALLAPLIDPYGQVAGASWPGKTMRDADLRHDVAEEDRRLQAWSASQRDYDAYGGWRKAGWHGAKSSVFRTVRHAGVWWLLTPEGNPCFYTGVSTAPALEWERTPITGREGIFAKLPPRDGATAAAWGGDSWGKDPGTESVSFATVNLVRKYGSDWRSVFPQRTTRRVKAWGFSGLGKWSDFLPGVPSLPVLSRSGVPSLAGHPDPFDAAIQEKLRASLATQITPHLHDPTVIAWSLGNEYDEIITGEEIRRILAMGSDVPAKRALTDEAIASQYGGDATKLSAAWGVKGSGDDAKYGSATIKVPNADVETLRRFYADRYYGLVQRTMKSLDPQRLYAGFWIVPGWWENEEDWRLIARHCDLIGYDNYGFEFADARLSRLIRESGKPVLCGEFSFPPQYEGKRGFGHYDAAWAQNETDSGRLYTRYTEAAARNPFCVGAAWFQYRDEPASGRGPGHGPGAVYGEHYAFGLVDITDNPKWALLEPMRRANLAASHTHQGFRKPISPLHP
ncbi:MAG: glycosyl hydrolase [Capsulimonas sp.]|uniref:glycosyl hydrolase n=1 Tax=Capsulimonas sp. TaxID=2494211 RepID=UPI003265C9E1